MSGAYFTTPYLGNCRGRHGGERQATGPARSIVTTYLGQP